MESRESFWVGFDVSKNSFSAAFDCHAKSCRTKITMLPCRDFKRTPEGVEQFFLWVKKTVPGHDIRIVMETTGCCSQHLTDWINQLHPEVGVTIENARNIHAFIQSLNLPHRTGNCGIRFKYTFIVFEPKIIRTASANSLSGFYSRSPENSGSSGISSTFNWQRQEKDDSSICLHAENASDPSFYGRS